jgi:hypothetical protein
MTMPTSLTPEDDKLLTLALATARRLGAGSAAAVRDDTGRTYVATVVDLPSLQLSALQAVVAVASASGAAGLEAALLVNADAAPADAAGVAAVRELGGSETPVYVAAFDGPANVS